MKLDELLHPPAGGPRPVVAIPMPEDPDIVACVTEAVRRGIAGFLLVGGRGEAERIAAETDPAAVEFVPARGEAEACALAARLVRRGRAQVLMKGLVSTAAFLHAVLDKDLGFVPAGGLISHAALFEIPAYHKPLLVTDAAINISPGPEEKARILRNALDCARRLGIARPKAAVICPVEKVKEKIASTVHARRLKESADAGRFGTCEVDGPLALDVALSRRAAEIKGVAGEVAGDPDVLLLPGLDAANVLYKSLTVLAGARTAGVVLGLGTPVVLTSRADSGECRLLSLGLALALARGGRDALPAKEEPGTA